MRSRDDSVDHPAAVEHALRTGVVGVGGRLDPPAPLDLDDAVDRVASAHDERTAARLRRFAGWPTGSFVWTRDGDGETWLGRIEGPWRHDGSEAATAADLQHVRHCRWLEQPVPWSDVPAGVRATFERGGRNLQRIHDTHAEASTADLWDRRGPH